MDKLIWGVFCMLVFSSVKADFAPCDTEFSTKCLCGETKYEDKIQYVVNCSFTNFQNASILQNLPTQTEVLIFTGNNISELPINLFGTTGTHSDLKVIDMSNNNIQDILGKSFHRVSNVERLILNHNKISISSKEPSHHHPRVFSNFENLLELHLTDAFADNTPAEDLASDLHDIFVNSDLQALQKLHLEQNDISQFKDPSVFCDLPNLLDLHLGQNKLDGLHFYIDCLPKLRFLDLEFNNIKGLSEEDREILDNYANTHAHNLTIDIRDNSLSGDCDNLFFWIQNTQVKVRNTERLRCHKSVGIQCVTSSKDSSGTTREQLLMIALSLTSILLIITNRQNISKQMRSLVDITFQRVGYNNLARQEEQEMNV